MKPFKRPTVISKSGHYSKIKEANFTVLTTGTGIGKFMFTFTIRATAPFVASYANISSCA
jgi:hypothetical protein